MEVGAERRTEAPSDAVSVPPSSSVTSPFVPCHLCWVSPQSCAEVPRGGPAPLPRGTCSRHTDLCLATCTVHVTHIPLNSPFSCNIDAWNSQSSLGPNTLTSNPETLVFLGLIQSSLLRTLCLVMLFQSLDGVLSHSVSENLPNQRTLFYRWTCSCRAGHCS